MTNIWETNGGVYFGYGCDATEGVPPRRTRERQLRYTDDRHIVSVGPNGSGKSYRLLYHNLMELTAWSMVVIDPKGDLYRDTAKHRAEQGGTIIRLDPFGAASEGFNPVAALDPASDDFPDDALSLAEALIRVEGDDPHWSSSAQEFVAALIMYVRLVVPNASLKDVRALLGQRAENLRSMVLEESIEYDGRTIPGMEAAAIIHGCDELTSKCSRFADFDANNKEFAGIVSVALTQTRWLDSKPVKTDLTKGRFDFSLLKEKPVTVYLVLPARRLRTHSTWFRLMITSILQPLMKDTGLSSVPVLMMLDEFAQLGHMPEIEQNMAMMRGYGIKLWVVLQDAVQAEAIYGKRWESFVANAGILQSFAPRDMTTAQYLSKLTGQTTRHPLGGGTGPNAQFSTGQTGVPLMSPQDLMNMDEGFSVLFSNLLKGVTRHYLPYPRIS
jgi:type IV secretion system protein VirD4